MKNLIVRPAEKLAHANADLVPGERARAGGFAHLGTGCVAIPGMLGREASHVRWSENGLVVRRSLIEPRQDSARRRMNHRPRVVVAGEPSHGLDVVELGDRYEL